MIPVFGKVTLRVSRDNDLIHIYLENSPKKVRADWFIIVLLYLNKNTELARAVEVMMARAKRIYILMIKVNKLLFFFLLWYFLKEIENMFSVFLSSFSINLLSFYHDCRPLIGYATHVLFCDRQ